MSDTNSSLSKKHETIARWTWPGNQSINNIINDIPLRITHKNTKWWYWPTTRGFAMTRWFACSASTALFPSGPSWWIPTTNILVRKLSPTVIPEFPQFFLIKISSSDNFYSFVIWPNTGPDFLIVSSMRNYFLKTRKFPHAEALPRYQEPVGEVDTWQLMRHLLKTIEISLLWLEFSLVFHLFFNFSASKDVFIIKSNSTYTPMCVVVFLALRYVS